MSCCSDMGADVLFEDDWMEIDGSSMRSVLMPNGKVKKLELPTTCGEHCWPNLAKRGSDCREGATSGRDRLISISKDFKRWVPRWRTKTGS